MKKLLAIILSALLLTALVACSADEANGGNGYDDYKDTSVEETHWTDTKNKNTFYFEAVDSESITITGFSTTNSAPHTVDIPAKILDKWVVGISKEAFANASEIKTLNLPAADKYGTNVPDFVIGESAFRGCFALETINIPAYVTSIAPKAFYGCEGATTVTFAAGTKLTLIDASVFQGCEALTSITIPGTIKKIETAAFFGCTSLATLTIEDGVEELGAQAFQNCYALENVSIPKSLVTVGKHAFANCDAIKKASIPTWIISEIGKANLVEVVLIAGDAIPASAFKSCAALTTITLNAEIKSIGEYAFVGCRSLKALEIPEAITEIGNSTFSNCSALVSVKIPAGVTTIGNAAFSGCDTLTEIHIPAAVVAIGDEAFASCDKLTKITVAEENKAFVSVDGHLYNAEKTVLLQYAIAAEADKYSVPETVVEIKPAAFESCLTLKTIVVPETVKTFGKSVFAGCMNLADVTIPANAITSLDKTGLKVLTVTNGTEIPTAALSNAKLLETVSIPDTIKVIGDGAFSGCASLKAFSIPAGIEKVGNNVFYGCAAMKTVVIPSSVKTIGESAFYGCASLEAIAIPADVTSIGAAAFRGCASIRTVEISKALSKIGNFAFNECSSLLGFTVSAENEAYSAIAKDLYNKDGTVLIQYALGKTDTDGPVLSDKVKEIAPNAFLGALNLTDIEIPATVETIGADAFGGCVNLKSAIVPAWAIGKLATDSLVQLGINAGTKIGEGAFANCKKLESILLADTITSVDESAFEGCENLIFAIVPTGVIGALPKAQIRALYLTGDVVPANACKEFVNLEVVSFEDTVTKIGESAFADCKMLRSIIISASVKTIEAGAFSRTHGLVEIYVDDANESYKAVDNVLYSKDGKTLILYPAASTDYSFVIPEGVTDVAKGAFNGAKHLVAITVSKDVKTIGDTAFTGCSKLVEVKNLSAIDIQAGNGNGNIAANKNVNVYKDGDSKVSVKDDFVLFTTKDGDANVVMLMGYVGDAEEITIPANVTVIASYAFTDTSVVTFNFAGAKEAWEKLAKADNWADGIVGTVKCTDGEIALGEKTEELVP